MLMRMLIVASLVTLFASGLLARDPVAYVINTTGETLSKVNLRTGTVSNDILALGSDLLCYPNQIVVRDAEAYVVVSGTDEIQIIDLPSETTVGFIDLPPGSSPFWMAFLDCRHAYVTNWVSGTVCKIDTDEGTILDEVPVGLSPEGIVISNYKAYVAITAFDQNTWEYGQGRVVVFDTFGDTVLAELNVGKNPQYLATDGVGRVHVVCTGDYVSSSGMIYVINTERDRVIDSLATGGFPGNITITPDDMAYLAAGGWTTGGYVYTYDPLSLELYHGAANPLTIDSGVMMVVAYQDSTVFVGAFTDYVTSIDSGGTVLGRYAVGDGPIHADFNYVPGDLDGDFGVDIADLVYMVDFMFTGGPPARYPEWRANVTGDFSLDISDLVHLVDYEFTGGPPPCMGPTWWR